MQIHETAFVVSTYRSFYEDVSKDTYAKLWNNSATDALIPDILKSVSEHEAILHSLRNRFFYERMNSFFKEKKGGTLINFGSGFSMYQFSFDDDVSTIEIDKKDIVDYKKEKVDHWIKDNKLPHRDIRYTAIDFNKNSVDTMVSSLQSILKKEPTFILIEGVVFFLDRQTTNKLFEVFKRLQKPGDLVGVVTYLPQVENTKVYKRLLHYFDSHNDTGDSFMHQTIPDEYFHKIDGYQVKESTDEFEMAKIHAPTHKIKDRTEILNETMYILEKS